MFQEKADAKRIQAYEKIDEEYKSVVKLKEDPLAEVKPESLEKFGLPSDKKVASEKLNEEPHRNFYAGAVQLGPKLVYDLDEMTARKIIKDHWWCDPYGRFVNANAQLHFFGKVFPTLDPPVESAKEVSELGIPMLFVFGETDFVTPLPEETAKELSQLQGVTLEVIPKAGHAPYAEEQSKVLYSDTLLKFVQSLSIEQDSSEEAQHLKLLTDALPLPLFISKNVMGFWQNPTKEEEEHSSVENNSQVLGMTL